MFPCFDQPNIKGVLSLKVLAPADWLVISNENSQYTGPLNTKQTVFEFGITSNAVFHDFITTKTISSYLYAVCAGPYYEYREDINETGIPLGIYCRQSAKQHLNPSTYINWTIQGFKFYQSFFDIPYPFTKYDQVFVPEFNYGAMENVGCVTYRESLILKPETSELDQCRICNVFLHEMAHMWFGNLVTMNWWDDLWLNEGFATFISQLAQSMCLEDTMVWDVFLRMKNVAYHSDKLPTTHPVSVNVENSSGAESLFDAISYGKGSALLKQLFFLVGEQKFREGLHRYLSKNAWKNTTFEDFIAAVGGGEDIKEWGKSWVKSAGVNTLCAYYTVEQGKIASFEVLQTANAHTPGLRKHTFLMQLCNEDMSVIESLKVRVLAQKRTKLPALIGLPAPALTLLNYEDHSYFLTKFDPTSVATIKKSLHLVESSLTRYQLWLGLWQMVTSYEMSGVEFLETVLEQFTQENAAHIGQFILEHAQGSISRCPTTELRTHYSSLVFSMITSVLETKDFAEYQNMLFGFLCAPEDIEKAVSWLENSPSFHFEVSQQRRWGIIKSYATISPDAKGLLETELNRDNSDDGKLAALYCESAYPEPSHKRSVWEKLLREGPAMSRYERNAAFNGFFHGNQLELSELFYSEFFEKTAEVISGGDIEYAKDFCLHWMPAVENEAKLVGTIDELLGRIPEDQIVISNIFKNHKENRLITLKSREVSQEYIDSKEGLVK